MEVNIANRSVIGPILALASMSIREDTHKKNVFFSGRTTKGVGRGNPPDH